MKIAKRDRPFFFFVHTIQNTNKGQLAAKVIYRMESIPLLLRKLNTQDYLGMDVRPSSTTSIAPENSNRIRISNLENQNLQIKDDFTTEGISDPREMRWLYRFFPLWIFLAVVVGLIFGTLVPNTGSALGKGRFLGVPAPSG